MKQAEKSAFVALAGRPNVGKSTLMNALVGQKIAIISKKAQTTRNRIMSVYDDPRGQLVFFDTPGIHRARTKLGDFMEHEAERALGDADLVLWLVEPRLPRGEAEEQILSLMQKSRKKKLLCINKTDLLYKELGREAGDAAGDDAVMDAARIENRVSDRIREIAAHYRERAGILDVVAVSAYKKQNLEALKELMFQYAPEGPRYYDEDTVTDVPVREIAAELIREQALYKLKDEVPHGIAVLIEEMRQRSSGLWDVKASIVCEREQHKGIIIGKGGAMLKNIGTGARIQIEDLLESRVNLKLFVKVRKDWRDNPAYLREYGYQAQ